MGLELFGLFVDALEDFVGIGVYVEVHFLVVVGGELVGVVGEHVVDEVVVFEVACFSWNDMNHEVFDGGLWGGVLDVDGGGGHVVVAFEGLGHEPDRQAQVEHFHWFELTELFYSSFRGE